MASWPVTCLPFVTCYDYLLVTYSGINFIYLMANILIVCTANICRSPVVHALLADRLLQNGYPDWQVASAGTWADRGQLASQNSVEVLAEQGFDISGHRSQPVDKELLVWADLVLGLATGHVEALRAEFPGQAYKISLLTAMSGQPYSVYDPYGEPRPAYERMVDEVTRLVDEGFPRIIELSQENQRRR
jgi:protein-tyrosine phosphatase